MFLAERMIFLQDMFQMTAIMLVTVINHFHIKWVASILTHPVLRLELSVVSWYT